MTLLLTACIGLLISTCAWGFNVADVNPNPQQPTDPIIAVVTTPLSDCFGMSAPPAGLSPYPSHCVESLYPRWLESAGIRVVALRWNASSAERRALLGQVNGVLLPGGALGGQEFDWYVSNQTEVFNYAMERNAKGDPFFMWGTCQGFQVISVIAAKDTSILKCIYHGMEPLMMPLNFTANQPTSRLFGPLATSPENIVRILRAKNSTLNWHSCGISPTDYRNNLNLQSTMDILSTNVDPTGLPFVSAVEVKKANIYAVQFHAERPPLEFSNDKIGHSDDDILVSMYLSRFIARFLRYNNHSFPSALVAEAHMVENYPLQNLGWGESLYWLPDNA